VAEKEEKSASIPWLPLITLIGLGSGVIFFFPQLVSSRPGGGEPRLAEDTFDDQTVDARLWQDPLGVAIESRAKEATQDEMHSIERFQKLFIDRCYPERGSSPLKPPEEKTNQIAIVAVMVPGGPYVEDVERRIRSRRAVIEGLGIKQYDPEKDHEIGYFCVPWLPLYPSVGRCVFELEQDRFKGQSNVENDPGVQAVRRIWQKQDKGSSRQNVDILTVPYEWFEPATFNPRPQQHILVLWLVDDAFRDAPLARLADLISWFRLRFVDTSGSEHRLPLPVFNVLGPDNSGTLHKIILEAQDHLWGDDTRQCLATTHVYSCQAAAAENQLLSEIPPTNGPLICKDLIEQGVRFQQSNNAFSFERTILLDNQIVEALLEELECRGVKKNNHVAIISEEDTFYARALSSTFRSASSARSASSFQIHPYTYLRGIDGKLPSEKDAEKETKVARETAKITHLRADLLSRQKASIKLTIFDGLLRCCAS